MIGRYFAITFTLWALPLASPSQACSCLPTSAMERFEWAATVFVGVVTDQELMLSESRPGEYGSRVLSLQVVQVWKGDVADTVMVEAPPDSAQCGFELVHDGDYYLVYSIEGDDPSYFSTHICMGTTNLCTTSSRGIYDLIEFDGLGIQSISEATSLTQLAAICGESLVPTVSQENPDETSDSEQVTDGEELPMDPEVSPEVIPENNDIDIVTPQACGAGSMSAAVASAGLLGWVSSRRGLRRCA